MILVLAWNFFEEIQKNNYDISNKFISIKTLEKNRPYIIVSAFIVGAIFTPPDIISQVLLALPILFLYEIGLFISKNKLIKRH